MHVAAVTTAREEPGVPSASTTGARSLVGTGRSLLLLLCLECIITDLLDSLRAFVGLLSLPFFAAEINNVLRAISYGFYFAEFPDYLPST